MPHTYIPSIQITLYRIRNKESSAQDVDCGIDFTTQLKAKAPSNEFLKSVNAELVCGPLDLATFIDISCQTANVVMTSPGLVLSKTRNFYLHLKAKLPEDNNMQPQPDTTPVSL